MPASERGLIVHLNGAGFLREWVIRVTDLAKLWGGSSPNILSVDTDAQSSKVRPSGKCGYGLDGTLWNLPSD